MSRDALPYPPKMRNGGSPPALLFSSYLSDPSSWLRIKWLQPPPRTPKWLFDYYECYNPPLPDTFGRPICNEDWLQRAICEDQQAAGLLPPAPLGGGILLGAGACADRAYRDWKRAIDELWADKHHRLWLVEEQAACARQEEDARRQKLLDVQAARARQEAAAHARQEETAARARQEEAARRQKLLDEQAARAHQEAAARARQEETAARARQEEAACRQRAAEARKTAATQLIFLWLHRRRLYARLASQTSRRQQREAALDRQHHEDECFARALQAEKQRMQVAAAQAKVLADEAKVRHRQAEAAIVEQRRQAAAAQEKQAADDRRAVESAALALIEERCCQEALLAAEANVATRKCWRQRPTYNVATRKCWRRRLMYNVAMRKCWRRRPMYNVATRKCWRRRQPMYNVGTSRPHGLRSPTR